MSSKLSDLCYYAEGRIAVADLDLDSYLSTENMLPNKEGITRSSGLPTVSQTQAYQADDVLVSNIRPYFRKIWFADREGGCSNDVLVLRAKETCNPGFLYYLLSDNNFFDYATATGKGTKMPRGDKGAIMRYAVPDIPLDTQIEIADTLTALDDKIENNAKINPYLEQMAQAIFKSWFVDFEPSFIRLGDVCQCVLGGTPSRAKPEYWGGSVPWINSGKVNEFRITEPSEWITEIGLNNSATRLLPAKTTVLAITGATLGQVSLLEIEACANQSVVGIVSNEVLPYTFIYPFMVDNIDELITHQTGGAQQHINKQNIESLEVPCYPEEAIAEYDRTVAPIFEQISNNCFESVRLAELRDTLLPHLMSGELSVITIDNSK